MTNKRRIFVLILVVVLALLGFSYWYMMCCEGEWDDMPLEASMQNELGVIERELWDIVSYFADTLGQRNPPHYEALTAARDWITAIWESQGYEVKTQSFLVEGKECTNLEIEIPGRSVPSEIVILSAQYDTWPDAPGANNNGSGMAVLLKLSEMLKSHQPDRTLRLVAFTTQEPPYTNTEAMGSLRYAQRCRERDEDIRVEISMDAIGIYKHEPGTQKIPFPFSLFYPSRGNFLAFIADLKTRPYVVETTRGFKKGSSFPIEAASVPGWVKGASWSDHGSFWQYGYAGMQITDTGTYRALSHTTSEDTIEKIDFTALARITIGMYCSILELTSAR
jgi:hypothetical protein